MPLWTPAQITTARWFDFSNASSVTAISGAVSQINDLSGNNDHLLQATPASRPAYTLAQQNGLNVATFDGTDDSLSFASNFSLGTAHSIFWIGKPSATITTSSPSRTLWSGGSYVWPSTTTSDFLWVSGAVSGNFTNERLTSLVVGYAVGTQDVIGYAKTNADISGAFIASTGFTTSGNSFRGRLNGQDDYATAGVNGGYSSTNTRYPTLLRTLGMRHAFTNAFWSGEVWETVVVPSYLTQQQTEQMEGYLAWKWGVQSSLPANHPYKNAAPEVAVGIGGEVGWWCPSLDNAGNGTANLIDLTGSTNNGTLTNMAPANDWISDIEKGGIRALGFDGINDQVVTTAPGITATDRSTSLWFRTNRSYSTGQYGILLRWGTAASFPADIGKDWQVVIGTDANLGTNGIGISQYGDAVGATGFNDGKWHHLYVESRGNLYSVYVDGVLRVSKTMTTSATAGTITIGSSFNLPYRDYLDDIRVFNRALNASEISTLASRRGTGTFLWTAERVAAKAWYDASDRLTIFNSNSGGSLPADNQNVGRWQDRSGNNRHLVQANTSPRPLRRTSVQNGLDAIRFDDQDDRLFDNGASSYWTFLHASTSSVFYVAKINTANPDGLGFPRNLCSFFGTFDTSFSNRGWITYFDDRSASGANNRIVSSTGPGNGLGSTAGVSVNDGFPTLQANLVTVIGDMQNATISNRIAQKVNGGVAVAGSFGTQSASSSDPTHALRVGMVWDAQWAMNGDMYEIIIIEGIVSDLVRDQIEGYLAWKWGIQSFLPSDHPYKNAAPMVQLGGRRRRNIGNHGL